jgi:universal stress protein E
MRRFGKILVGVELVNGNDDSAGELTAPSQAAFEQAVWLARANESELIVFSAIDVPPQLEGYFGDRMGDLSRKIEKDVDAALVSLVERAAAECVSAVAQRAFGKPSVEIIRRVERDGIDLVVVGTRDLSRAGRFLFGSTGLKLLHRCPCAVWVTKDSEIHEATNVLVANDLSELSLDALQLAVNLGQLVDTKTRVLHAVEHDLDARFWGLYLSEAEISAYRRTLFNNAERTLHEQLAQTDYRTLRYGVLIDVVEGPADQAILNAIMQHNIDLLVIGTVARGGLSRVFVGNTAERLLAQVGCSVLAVKPRTEQSKGTVRS